MGHGARGRIVEHAGPDSIDDSTARPRYNGVRYAEANRVERRQGQMTAKLTAIPAVLGGRRRQSARESGRENRVNAREMARDGTRREAA